MEPLTPAKRLTAIAAGIVLAAGAGVAIYREVTRQPLAKLVRADLPLLELTVKLRDSANQDLDAANSLVGSNDEVPAGDERCPALVGGDTGSASAVDVSVKRPADCPKRAAWYVRKHPVAFTLYFNQGEAFLQWWDQQAEVQRLLDNRFVKGLFFGLLQSLHVKAEQLNLQGIQGDFLLQVLRDAVGANAELHYDMAHGSQGWVIGYSRSASRFADQAMPALAGVLASSGYRVGKLPEPILEARIGLQKLFVTEYDGRIYLAQSLEALLNVLDSIAPEAGGGDAPLSLVLRSEAFVAHLLPVMAGAESYPIRWDFALTGAEPGWLSLPAASWQRQLHPRLFDGVVASMPHDAFAGFAASLALPPDLTGDDWRKLAAAGPSANPPGPEPAGIGVVWDFSPDDPAGAVGVVVANPGQPQASPAYAQYLKNPDLGAECAGGSLFLAASSANLLTRMKDACNKQSLSPLDWQRGAEKQRLQDAQLLAFVNPATAARELFLAGGAGANQDANEFAPRWQQDYEAAKAAMRRDGDKLFANLPLLSYAGRVADNASGARLQGKLVAQAVAAAAD
ncbi:hypothetical protein [Methylomonas koyamae]|uniref:Uncharacterized protein n=1 Tax=Methylomonas koyamae TaxID=702114 RepID=A0A291IDY0_9GAMM|nr:hypothetical protein [Methylomonas koyamae]ATG88399.1 hypothetical protein MKLM6_0114 [Methylomonas koyamae]OAI21289.1 hypothetical protein A1356_21250 [Methylomonas koyamae]